MKKLFKKVVSVGLTAALTLSMAITGISSASALTTNDYYNTYTTVADIKNRDGCSAMQGMAVGSTYLYTVKIKTDNSGAVLQKTNKNTGATTNLTNSTGKIYNYLNHANDMDVTTIDGYSQLFVATMATGGNSLVRIKVNGSKATKSAGYTLMYNGAQKSVSGVAVEWTDANNVYLLLKSGATVYRATVPKAATSGTINITKAFTLNTSSVKVNGSYVNLSSYTHQGMGYYDGKIYVPLWGGGAGKSNQAVIAVYDTHNASGSVKSDPFLSFRVTSGAYSGFEIESCDISSDGQMYCNVNRWTASSGNYDAILRFNGFVANGFNPDGNVDVISGGQGTVYVRGWAFDKDCASMSIPVHVYIGGEAGRGEGHAITANTYRNDVNGAFGCGDYHGFDATISTSLRGSQPVYLYAINTRKGTNVMIGSGWVNIQEKQYSIYDYGIADIGSGFYANIVNVGANKNVAIDLGTDNVLIYDRMNNADHVWRFDRCSNGAYKITNMYNGKCLDLDCGTNADGVNVHLWSDNGSSAQRWFIYNVNGRYALKAECSDRVLDVAGGSTENCANMQSWTFNGTNAQLFSIDVINNYRGSQVDLGSGFYAKIGNVNSNMDVAVDMNNNNAVIYGAGDYADHIWRFDRYGDGSYKITNQGDFKCLDVSGASGAAGANVGVYNDNGSAAQRWYIYKFNGNYVLKSACTDCYLDINGAGTASGTNVQMWNFNGSLAQQFTINKVNSENGWVTYLGGSFTAQIGNVNANKNLAIDLRNSNGNVIIYDKSVNADHKWRFDRYDDGSYKITNLYNGKCLDVNYASSAAGANVDVYDDNGTNAQKWYIYSYNGGYVLKSACTNCYLDVNGAYTDNYTNVQMYTFNGTLAQQFTITKI